MNNWFMIFDHAGNKKSKKTYPKLHALQMRKWIDSGKEFKVCNQIDKYTWCIAYLEGCWHYINVSQKDILEKSIVR